MYNYESAGTGIHVRIRPRNRDKNMRKGNVIVYEIIQ